MTGTVTMLQQITALKRENRALRKELRAWKRAANQLGANWHEVGCKYLNHGSDDYHGHDEPCPVEKRRLDAFCQLLTVREEFKARP